MIGTSYGLPTRRLHFLYLISYFIVIEAFTSTSQYFDDLLNIDNDCVDQIVDKIQPTLVISNSKGLSETLRDIRTSTYQIFRIEEKIIRTTTFNKYICTWSLDVRDTSKIL